MLFINISVIDYGDILAKSINLKIIQGKST